MRASQFKMPALYLATRAAFLAIYRFVRSGLLWWLLCFNFGAVACKCDKCQSGERGCVVSAGAGAAPQGHELGVRCRAAAEKQPSPLQNKPLPQPQVFGAWGRVPPGHELLQSFWYPFPWEEAPAFLHGIFWHYKVFFFILPLFPLPFERKNAGSCMLHFSLWRKKSGFSFFYSYMEQCMILICCLKRRVFLPNPLKPKGLSCVGALCCLTFVSSRFSSGGGYACQHSCFD